MSERRDKVIINNMYTKVRWEINKYGSSAENHPGAENMQWVLGEKERILVFLEPDSEAGRCLKGLEAELFPKFHEETQGVRQTFQVRFELYGG